MPENVRPDSVSEIGAIFAKGFLRYRKSRRFGLSDEPQNALASTPKPSVHVSVVDTERTDEN
jgi:hypothetical protein